MSDAMIPPLETRGPARHIVVVHDKTEAREALMAQLAQQNDFAAIAVETGIKGLQATAGRQVDLLIMNVDLPDVDGREAVRILRERGFKAPIMLTGGDTESDTVLGLEAGANDYISEPCRFPVLLARIRAQLRQHEASEDAAFVIGKYTFRPSLRMLFHPDGHKMRLTDKESAILKYLYRALPRAVPHEVLLREVWGYNARVRSHTLYTYVYRLRQKLEVSPRAPTILITEGHGYKLASGL
jgi:DNA-binding response OmpR family regulator